MKALHRLMVSQQIALSSTMSHQLLTPMRQVLGECSMGLHCLEDTSPVAGFHEQTCAAAAIPYSLTCFRYVTDQLTCTGPGGSWWPPSGAA